MAIILLTLFVSWFFNVRNPEKRLAMVSETKIVEAVFSNQT